MYNLVYNPCEWTEKVLGDPCRPWLAPPHVSTNLVSYMRKPECRTSFAEWHRSHPTAPPWSYTNWNDNHEIPETINWSQMTVTTSVGCCDSCAILGGNVDVYYWPVSGANSACLSTIGTSYGDPNDGYFTTDARGHKLFMSRPNPYASSQQANSPITSRSPSVGRMLNLRSPGSFVNSSQPANHTISEKATTSGSIAIIDGHTL